MDVVGGLGGLVGVGCSRGLEGDGELSDDDGVDGELSPYSTDDQIDLCINHKPVTLLV